MSVDTAHFNVSPLISSRGDAIEASAADVVLLATQVLFAVVEWLPVFVSDESPKVRQAAQRYGKILYWSAVYWDMEQSGALAEEMQRRAAEIGKAIKVKTEGGTAAPGQMPSIPPGQDANATPAAAQSASQAAPKGNDVDVSEILRKAQEGRKRRKSRGR